MKKIIVISIMVLVISGTAFAQAVTGWESPQSASTQGRLRSAADDFIRPDAYKGVSFNNTFNIVSFDSSNRATIGFAAKNENIYISAFYRGSFLYGKEAFNYTEGYRSWLGGFKVTKEYTSLTYDTNDPYNQLAVLIGVGDMGFRLALTATLDIFSDTDFISGTTQYKSYSSEKGHITPQLAWSFTKNLASNGIKPWATIDLAFNRNNAKSTAYFNNGTNWAAENEKVITSNNTFVPTLNLGLGGYTIANKNSWRTSADLDYTLALTIWDNEFNYTSSAAPGSNSIGKINGTVSGTGELAERSLSSNTITPSVSTQWNGEKLRLRLKFNLPFVFTNDVSTDMYRKTNDASLETGTLGKDGNDKKTGIFNLSPNLRLAAQWQLASKLFLNAGGRINVSALTVTTVDNRVFDEDIEVPNSSTKSVTNTFAGTTTALTLGTTINATDNLFIEASCGVSANNGIDVFSTTPNQGLFTFGRILVGLKF